MKKKTALMLVFLILSLFCDTGLVTPAAGASPASPAESSPTPSGAFTSGALQSVLEPFQSAGLEALQANTCAFVSTEAERTKFLKRLVRLTVVNKSGRAIELGLSGRCLEKFYYLRVPEGDRLAPTEMVFTVSPDIYQSYVYYFEYWDPVYGTKCGAKAQSLDMRHNVRLMVFECDQTPVNNGEPPAIVKYGGQSRKRMR